MTKSRKKQMILYGGKQYAAAGETMIGQGGHSYGGTYPLDNLDKHPNFLQFLIASLDVHKCENGWF